MARYEVLNGPDLLRSMADGLEVSEDRGQEPVEFLNQSEFLALLSQVAAETEAAGGPIIRVPVYRPRADEDEEVAGAVA